MHRAENYAVLLSHFYGVMRWEIAINAYISDRQAIAVASLPVLLQKPPPPPSTHNEVKGKIAWVA